MVATCSLRLHNDPKQVPGHYNSGQEISGQVICSFSRPTNITDIRVELKGTEYTWWPETSSVRSVQQKALRTVHQEGTRIFLNTCINLNGRVCHAPGDYTYYFSFTLRDDLPGSYYGSYGCIIYKVTGMIIIPFRSDHTYSKLIRIMAPIDFNMLNIPMVPLSYSMKKDYSIDSVPCGTIMMKVHMEKPAFLLYEMIRVRVHIKNMSTIEISRVEVRLDRTIQFKSYLPDFTSKIESEVLNTASCLSIEPNGFGGLLFGVRVPADIEVPNFYGCKFLRHTAAIWVTLVLPGKHSNLEFMVPVTLGNSFDEEYYYLTGTLPPTPSLPPQAPGVQAAPSTPHSHFPLEGALLLPPVNDYRSRLVNEELLPPRPQDIFSIPCVPLNNHVVTFTPSVFRDPSLSGLVRTRPKTEQLKIEKLIAHSWPSSISSVSSSEQPEKSRSLLHHSSASSTESVLPSKQLEKSRGLIHHSSTISTGSVLPSKQPEKSRGLIHHSSAISTGSVSSSKQPEKSRSLIHHFSAMSIGSVSPPLSTGNMSPTEYLEESTNLFPSPPSSTRSGSSIEQPERPPTPTPSVSSVE